MLLILPAAKVCQIKFKPAQEIRNKPWWILLFRVSKFGFVSDFDIRVSNLYHKPPGGNPPLGNGPCKNSGLSVV